MPVQITDNESIEALSLLLITAHKFVNICKNGYLDQLGFVLEGFGLARVYCIKLDCLKSGDTGYVINPLTYRLNPDQEYSLLSVNYIPYMTYI